MAERCTAKKSAGAVPPWPFFSAVEYWVDAWQRSILLLDALRRRGNNYLEHNAREVPHVLSFAHIFNRPTGYGVWQEADKIAGMTGSNGYPDLAVVLHATDAGAMPGARVEHDEWPLVRFDRVAFGRDDAHQRVIHRPRQRTAIDQNLGFKAQYMGRRPRIVLDAIVAALTQYIEQEDRALACIDPVIEQVICSGKRPSR